MHRNGHTKDGRQRYRCPACGRHSRESRPAQRQPRCPHCGGRCRREGKRDRNRNQVYRCRDCGRYNSEGMRWPRPQVSLWGLRQQPGVNS